MHPIGHLATTIALSAGTYVVTHSPALTVGTALGGFLIDVDHYFDYVVFNGQRGLNPSRFLEYYIYHRFDWVVLPLHSYELMSALVVAALAFPHPLLVGYLIGAGMHMLLDVVFNQGIFRSSVRFYSFTYRARRGFAKHRLLRLPSNAEAPPHGS